MACRGDLRPDQRRPISILQLRRSGADFALMQMNAGRSFPTKQPPQPGYLTDKHVDDRRPAALVSFETALERVLEFFRIGHLLAIAAD